MFGLPIPSLKAIEFIAAGLFTLAVAAGSAWVTHKVDASKYEALELSFKAAQVEAVTQARQVQKRDDDISLAAAVAEAQAQANVVTQTQIVTKEVVRHVPLRCVPLGFVRVLDAAILGRDPDSLPLPAGKSDATCAPVDTRALAERLAEDIGAARANAEQLTALQAWVLSVLPHDRAPAVPAR